MQSQYRQFLFSFWMWFSEHKTPVYALQPADGSAPKLHIICFGMSTVLLKVAGSWMEALLERERERLRGTLAVTAEQCFPQLPELLPASLLKTKVFPETLHHLLTVCACGGVVCVGVCVSESYTETAHLMILWLCCTVCVLYCPPVKISATLKVVTHCFFLVQSGSLMLYPWGSGVRREAEEHTWCPDYVTHNAIFRPLQCVTQHSTAWSDSTANIGYATTVYA